MSTVAKTPRPVAATSSAPYDVESLCDALHEVVTDRDRHDALAQRGLQRAASFSWRRTAELHMEAFEFGLQRRRDRTT